MMAISEKIDFYQVLMSDVGCQMTDVNDKTITKINLRLNVMYWIKQASHRGRVTNIFWLQDNVFK